MTRAFRFDRIIRLLVGPVSVLMMAWLLAGCAAEEGGDGLAAVAANATAENGETQVGSVETAASGVTADSVLFGQSAAFGGPARELGLNMRLGIEAAFHEANQQGGVHGRRLLLVTKDDAYEPEAAIANTHQLIEEEGVFALIGAVGTPTSRSAVPVAAEAGVPYVAPFTGAGFLRDSGQDYVINLRASYDQETEKMVASLAGDLGLERIAVVYQDDSFGRAGYNGVLAALERREMSPAGIGVYPRNTTAVKTALLDIRRGCPDSCPQAVIVIGAYEPVAEFISWARSTDDDQPLQFMTISFVGSHALADQLGPWGEGVFVTQVVPLPTDDSIAVSVAYRRALSTIDAEAAPGFVSFEGYLAGRLAIYGLEACGTVVTRACFLESFRSVEVIDIDGFRLGYGDGDNQGSDDVFLTAIGPDGEYRRVSTLSDAQR